MAVAAAPVSSSPPPSSNALRRPPSRFNSASCSPHAHLRWRPRIHSGGLLSARKPATATSTSASRSEWRDPSDEIADRKKKVIGNRRRAWTAGGVEEGGGKVRRVACRAERGELAAVGGEVGYVVPERVKVAVMLALVMCLCNADRVVMSVAVVPLAARYGWSSSFLGVVQSSFMWGYLVSSLVAGGLADRYGGKHVMACGVAAWSLATFLTPWAAAHSTPMLLLFRVLFGLAEGVAIPSMTVILARWFPSHELASALGFSMAGFHMGNLISFLTTPVVMTATGVAGPFALFAALGFAWLSAWAVRVASEPRDCPLISGAELQLIRAGKKDYSADGSGEPPPLRYLLSKAPSWAILFANFTNNWGYYVLLSWMAVYFRTVFGVDLKQAAWFSAVPWGLMGLSGFVAGSASDMLIRSGHPVTRVRKIMQSIGFFGPGVALLCLNFAQTPAVAAVLLTVALSLSSFSQAGFLLTVQDIAPKYVGFLHGISNAMGTLGAIISTTATGYFVQWLGSFRATLTITAVLYFAAAIFWNIFATAEQVFF
ncbi:hypothetical protein Taro_017529 [Colocasia esculenta]|uniref:Major facilitator superfamily (MFS) profile domain-containing protein n=1 Tax=Colocasia esculenta TaxID=4460 RepID=A0A843UZM8_COLES|nr:hypothetical protein [Colocasia esculenta]